MMHEKTALSPAWRTSLVGALGGCALFVLAACGDRESAPTEIRWPADLVMPVPGATVPMSPEYLPGDSTTNAGRTRRGFDLIDGLSGPPFERDQEVVAAASGTVLQTMVDGSVNRSSSASLLDEVGGETGLAAGIAQHEPRGTQVWIRHDNGFISGYGQLGTVDDGIEPGNRVAPGQPIGTVGRVPVDGRGTLGTGMHFELWNRDGSAFLGDGRSAFEFHELVARTFGADSVPRYARRALEATARGEAVPAPYPPESMPEPTFLADPPKTLAAGASGVFPVQWDFDAGAFTPESFSAVLGERRLSILPADRGVWVLVTAPLSQGGQFDALSVRAIDPFGRVVVGTTQLQITEPARPPERSIGPALFESMIGPNSSEAERAFVERLDVAARRLRFPVWREAFSSPIDAAQQLAFGQPVRSGESGSTWDSSGILFDAVAGAPVVASNAGVVAFAGELPVRGLTVVVVHGAGVASVYSHLGSFSVERGQRVDARNEVGMAGETGAVDRPAVGWEIRAAGAFVDPMGWIGAVLPGRRPAP